MISIIIPVYNSEASLNRCLDSLIPQRENDWECILIDDGSTDSSGAICDQYASCDSRFKVFHTTNQGASSARNIGLDHALGQWITFLDSDDYVEPDYFMDVMNSSEDFIVRGLKLLKYGQQDNSIPDGIFYDNEYRAFLATALSELRIRCVACKFFRKDIIGISRFDQSLRLGEDTCFVLNYLNYCSSVKVDSRSSYCYDISDCFKKYVLDFSEIMNMFSIMSSAYAKLSITSPMGAFIYKFSFSLCHENDKTLWFHSKEPKEFYNTCIKQWLSQSSILYYICWIIFIHGHVGPLNIYEKYIAR